MKSFDTLGSYTKTIIIIKLFKGVHKRHVPVLATYSYIHSTKLKHETTKLIDDVREAAKGKLTERQNSVVKNR